MIRRRIPFFFAVEGQSERSLIKWLHDLSQKDLHVHLETYVLGGGGYKSMLAEASRALKKRVSKVKYKECFLLVDGDRASGGDWSVEKLRKEAKKHRITVCLQKPNHEAVLVRMIPGREKETCDAASAERQLKTFWATYQKPADARLLSQQFKLEHLLRMAKHDDDFRYLLGKIGLA
jgi:hypothetical protein